MNFKNSEEVIEAVQLFKLEPKVLDGNLSSFVLNNILRKFTNETKYNYPLWDKIEDSRAYKNKDAWKLLSKILKDKEVILFFDFADDKTMFLFSDEGF